MQEPQHGKCEDHQCNQKQINHAIGISPAECVDSERDNAEHEKGIKFGMLANSSAMYPATLRMEEFNFFIVHPLQLGSADNAQYETHVCNDNEHKRRVESMTCPVRTNAEVSAPFDPPMRCGGGGQHSAGLLNPE